MNMGALNSIKEFFGYYDDDWETRIDLLKSGRIDLEEQLKESAFVEYTSPRHHAGIPELVTNYRNIFYHFSGGVDLNLFLFNDKRDISDYRLYRFNGNHFSIKSNGGLVNDDKYCIELDSIKPLETGEDALKNLILRYPSEYWIGNVLRNNRYNTRRKVLRLIGYSDKE